MSDLTFISELWDALRDHIDLTERNDAADTVVNLLIDNNYEIDDIREAFRDKDITAALKGYTDEHFPEEEYEEYEEDPDEDPDW